MGKTDLVTLGMAVVFTLPASLGAQFVAEPAGEWWPGYPSTDSLTSVGLWDALATGDFNCDGYTDLAVGLPKEDVAADDMSPPLINAGVVNVFFGGIGGLDLENFEVLDQGLNFLGTVEELDRFGQVLAAGDFDHDDCDDLAVGIPFEGVHALNSAGAVQVFHGGIGGLGSDQLWTQDSADVLGIAEEGDGFGITLASGDFDGDTFDDLAIGVWGEDVGTAANAGAVNVLFGSGVGLTADGNLLLHRGVGPIDGDPTESEQMGMSIAAGQGDDDAQATLFIGMPQSEVAGQEFAGSLIILPNVRATSPSVDSEITQDFPGVPGAVEDGDGFGRPLAAADFDGNGHVDVAIGVRFEAVGLVEFAGAVNVFYMGPGAAAHQLWTRDSLPGPPLAVIEDDELGRRMLAGDFDSDGVDDLAISGRSELGTSAEVHVLFDLASGSATRQTLKDDSTTSTEGFGLGLTAGRFIGAQTGVDLVVSLPEQRIEGVETGLLQFFPNVLVFEDGFESGDTSAWSSTL